ncbi:hypothetical protein J2S74_000626 [Evansella vedderi]|uniref:PucR family transcriptional regulator n=1 Tax=Evansella vedderi TaxID=38282 RepID=A0ABT9ZQW6_9BACI|nr:PucR family transcriptional regulator [Evansella vedderi]MDQ0253254.1 hypothetical protein [Evansella vedderi]
MSFQSLITVKDLLRRPHFQEAEILSGHQGLNRNVKWVHILEVTEVGSLLNGGELILTTGIGWKNNEDIGVKFVEQLIESEASGMCIELNTYINALPEKIISIANKANFPIIVFHKQVRFLDITKDLYEFLHFPNDKKQMNICFTKLYENTIDPEILVKTFTYLFESIENWQGYVTLLSSYSNNLDLSKLNRLSLLAEENNLELIWCFMEEYSLYILIWIDKDHHHNHFSTKINKIIKQWKRKDYLFTVGSRFSTLPEIIESMKHAKEAYDICYTQQLDGIIFYNDLHCDKLFYHFDQSELLQEWIIQYLSPLMEYDKKNNGQLLQTLLSYLECQGSKKETADQLFIVRQTLYHRLEKIEELLQDKLNDPQKRFAVEFAVRGYFYKNERGGKRGYEGYLGEAP